MKTISAKEIKERIGVDVEQQKREQMTINRLCQFLHQVAEIGVKQGNLGTDGSVPVEDLIRKGFRHPEMIAERFIGQDAAFPLDGAHLKLDGGFYWTAEGKRYGSIELTDRESRARYPNFSKEVDVLIATYFPQRD